MSQKPVQTEVRSAHDGDEPPMKKASERAFGVAFAIVFTAIGLFPLLSDRAPRAWALTLAGVLLALALVKPALLAPLNRAWFRVALVLQHGVSMLAMGLLFYGVVTPTGLIMRGLGKDLLRLRYDRQASSYWLHRDPPGPSADSMGQQF